MPHLIFTFFFLLQLVAHKGQIMNEEVVTKKRSLGIGCRNLMGDSEVKGKHQLCHLSCNLLMVHGKRHYFSTFLLYWNMGVASWATFIFYLTSLNNCAFRAYILYPFVIQRDFFINWIEMQGKIQGGSLKHWDNHPLVTELGQHSKLPHLHCKLV